LLSRPAQDFLLDRDDGVGRRLADLMSFEVFQSKSASDFLLRKEDITGNQLVDRHPVQQLEQHQVQQLEQQKVEQQVQKPQEADGNSFTLEQFMGINMEDFLLPSVKDGLLPAPVNNDPTINTPIDTEANREMPKVAWFLSYPNSGTTYTQTAVQQATLTTVASFYGRESLNLKGIGDWRTESVQVYSDKPNGPFILSDQPLPNGGYILSKTHCGGFCNSCASTILNTQDFMAECATAQVLQESEAVPVRYDTNIIGKVVHLMRNPFDNVIARFHFEHVEYERKSKDIRWKKVFPKNADGFKEWCKWFDASNLRQEIKFKFVDQNTLEAFKKVPCHGQFFRYIQWHNNAFALTNQLNVPSHIVHYEDYHEDVVSTIRNLVDFLELEFVGEYAKFKRKFYAEYYTMEDKVAIISFLQFLSSRSTWENILPYVEEITDEVSFHNLVSD